MGNILSRFKSAESSKQTLERIHSEIEEIEDYKWITLRNQNHIICFYIFGLSIVYAIFVAAIYFNYMQRLRNKGLIASILFALTFPALAYFLRNFLKGYYQHKLALQEDRLHELKRNKRKLLNEIMEKETYKVAKELIEKYDPSMLREHSPRELDLPVRLNQSMNSSILRHRGQPAMDPMNQTAMASLSTDKKLVPAPTMMGSPMRRPAAGQPPGMPASTPFANRSMNQPTPMNPQQFNLSQMRPPPAIPARRPNLVRPVSSADRSIVEKLVDYMVGDGPNNRYALICKFCFSHNGMAHKDEFEYLNFRCCFCNNFNPARKQKPVAPTLVSFENAKESLTDETLTENLKQFQLNDSNETTKSQIEELESRLSDAKLDDQLEEEASKSTGAAAADDEMQVDDDSGGNKADTSKENSLRKPAELKEPTAWRLTDIDYADSNQSEQD